MMKLTIVLTIYNKAPYLQRIFDAILAQEGVQPDDFEVLAINDGSTDESETIMAAYQQKDSRIQIITQSNKGLSIARNIGTEAARGEYVWYVDADDLISPRSVPLICEAASTHPDIIPIYACTDGIDKTRNAINPNAHTGREILLDLQWEHCGVFYILRRQFLLDHELRFLPDIYHEDSEFTPRMLYMAQSAVVVPEILYTVFRDPYSITQIPRSKRAFDDVVISERLIRFVDEKKEQNTAIGTVFYNQIAIIINNALYIICKNSKKEQHRLNELFYEKRHLFIKVLKSVPQLKYRMEGFLFQMLPKHYVWVYKLMKRV